jgi:hypothetical protein
MSLSSFQGSTSQRADSPFHCSDLQPVAKLSKIIDDKNAILGNHLAPPVSADDTKANTH